MKPAIRIDDYFYHLPEDRIAKYPLAHRDDSKLLVNVDGKLSNCLFISVSEKFYDTFIVHCLFLLSGG